MFDLDEIRKDELDNIKYLINIDKHSNTLVDGKYIIYPYEYEYKYGYRLKKKEGDIFIPVMVKDMTEYEENLVRNYDIKTYGKSALIKDVLIRKNIKIKEEVDFYILPLDVFYLTKCRIVKFDNGVKYRKPLIFLNNFELDYIIKYEKMYNSSSITEELYKQENNNYKRLVKKYGNEYIFNECIDTINNIHSVFLFKNNSIYRYEFYRCSNDIIYKLYKNDKLIKIKYKGDR